MDRPKRVNQEVEQFSDSSWTNAKMIGTNGYPLLSLPYNDWVHNLYMLIPVYDGHQNPQLGISWLRESHLETLNTLPLEWKVATKEACSALTRAADNMANAMDLNSSAFYATRDAGIFVGVNMAHRCLGCIVWVAPSINQAWSMDQVCESLRMIWKSF